MARVVTTAVVDAGGLAERLRPRDDVVRERAAAGDGCFEADEGPFRRYERRVVSEPLGDGRHSIDESIEFELALPFWWLLFVGPYKHALRRPRRGHTPWWAPPQRLDRDAAHTLALLCSIAVVGGYLGSLVTQTITFAADEFGSTDAVQGRTLAALRAGVPLALGLVALADRRGRWAVLVGTAAFGCAIAVTGALSPNIVALGFSQTLARAFSTALGVVVLIVAAEEMPAGSRTAYAVSLLAMAGGLGSGIVLWALPLADLDERAWRLLYLIPLLGLPVVAAVGRRLPETRRFRRTHAEVQFVGHGRRLWLLAASAFLGAVFVAPASQLMNEFLRDERNFSALRISVFTALTNSPAALGIVVGGRLADVRGRRLVGSIGWAFGTLFTVAMFLAAGWSMWAWSVAGAMVGSIAIPALGVYGPELFPTSLRGPANGVITVAAVGGSAFGLLVVGQLSDSIGRLGPAMAILAVGPAVLAVLIFVAFPETAHRELEDLNPEDRLPPAATEGRPGDVSAGPAASS